MILRYFFDKKLAQASYLVGCSETGEALIVDPARQIEPYLKVAKEEGLKITHITETHIHADFVSGSRELAHHTDARLYLSDMGDADWKYGFADENTILLHEGDTIMVGNIKVDVLHTPGHTPEHICFMITDTKGADKPMGVFTGDFLFVGDVGRPDLLDETAGTTDTKEKGAGQQFQSIQRFKNLPDYLQIWPGHGAGSACGKSLGAVPSTTLGYEKLFNPALQFENEDEFVTWLLEGQPEVPRYFAQMKKVNKKGPALLETLSEPQQFDRAVLDKILQQNFMVVDMRNQDDFAKAFIPGTISIPASDNSFSTYVGWFADYEKPFYFIAHDETDIPRILEGLRGIGVDNIGGYFTADTIFGDTESLARIDAEELAKRVKQNRLLILDVRSKAEYEEEHLKDVKHIHVGHLPEHYQELPSDRPIAIHCASGYRAQMAATLLKNYGFEHVIPVNDEFDSLTEVLPAENG